MRRTVIAMVATASVVAAPSAVQADDDRELEVMTQNLYLGSSLAPALGATTPEGFVAGVATIYNTVVATDFPARARAIADEIAKDEPDLIGLQEVSNWIAQPTVAGRTPVSFDFLEILQKELAYRDLDYVVAATSDNANIGPVPLFAPQFGCVAPTAPDCVLTFHDRDVILANNDVDELTWKNAAVRALRGAGDGDRPHWQPRDAHRRSLVQPWLGLHRRHVRRRQLPLRQHPPGGRGLPGDPGGAGARAHRRPAAHAVR